MNPYKDHKNSNICQRIEKKYLPKIYFSKCHNENSNQRTLQICNNLRKQFYQLVYVQQPFYPYVSNEFKTTIRQLNDDKPLQNEKEKQILKKLEPLSRPSAGRIYLDLNL